MEEKKKSKNSKHYRKISLISIIFIIIIGLIIEGILIFIIIQNNKKQSSESILQNKNSSTVITDVPEIEAEPLPDLTNTTWKMSIFVEELIGENITEDEKQNILDIYNEDLGYVVFNENDTMTCYMPNNIINYEVDDNLIIIDISQEGLNYLPFEGSGSISLAYQNGMFISTNKPHLQHNNIEVKSRIKLEHIGSYTIPNLDGTKWKITHDLNFNNLSEEDENEIKETFELWDENLISFDNKQYTLGEDANNYSIMGCILKLDFFDLDEMIYEDGKFICKIDKTGPDGQKVNGTVILTKVNS